MSKYLFDTNVCIYFFREFPPVVRFMEELFQQNEQHEKLLSVRIKTNLSTTWLPNNTNDCFSFAAVRGSEQAKASQLILLPIKADEHDSVSSAFLILFHWYICVSRFTVGCEA